MASFRHRFPNNTHSQSPTHNTHRKLSMLHSPPFHLVLTFMLLSTCYSPCQAEDPTVPFSTPEEQQPGQVLGSLGDDTVLPLGQTPEIRGSLRYSLLPQGHTRSDLFTVDEDTGEISTKERLDREDLCGFKLICDLDIQVAVQSAVSQFFKKVKVIIRVDDINDHSPVFPRNNTQIHVPENVPIGTSFAMEGATDSDVGDNGVKSYKLLPDSGHFRANVTQGSDGRSVINLIVRRELDRETISEQTLIIQAVDGGDPARTGSLSVKIMVDDVNDNAPVFLERTYNKSLPETSKKGTKVIRVSATDRDTEEFGVKEYRFKTQQSDDITDYFSIDPTTGQIVTTGSLLQRQGQTFRLVVECIDKGLPPLVSRAEVEVTVEDTINSAPNINLNVLFQGSVSEVAQSGTVVALVGVEDRDTGLNGIVRCSIVSDAFELQAMSENEFKVIVVRQLDREFEPTHEVSVMCQDAGKPPLTDVANFTVKVKDENDETPYFNPPSYRRSIQENNRVGQILLRVVAQDDDIGENARISFDLLEAPDSLRIDNRGNIIATKPLDYEFQRQIRFKVIATDNGKKRRSNTANVVIDITDINDNEPIFEKPKYVFNISENNKINATVNSVKATDLDSGNNGKIRYAIAPPGINKFSISDIGTITCKEELDREKGPSYVINVLAIDKGIPPLTGTATVTIFVRDKNDHRPRIIFPKSGNTSVPITLDFKPNSVVLQIQAEDKDTGINNKLEYHLASSSGRSLFKVNKENGDLILRRKLTAQDTGKHRLTIVVMDKSSTHPMASNSTFDIVIFEDYNTTTDTETEHVMVVIILGVVTGVVTVAVIITIVVIRRADRQRRKYLQSRTKMPPDTDKFEENQMGVGYVISNDPLDGTTTTSKPPRGSKNDDSSRDVTQDEGFADKSFNTSQGSNGPTDQTEWSKALRLHQDLLKLHGVDSAFLMQGAGTLDDVTSDGSGESTTCDSGRGGSEEDAGSHGRASPVHRETSLNNLNHPANRPNRQKQGSNPKYANIPRGGLANLTGRQLGHSLDANLPSNPPRSTSVPTVKHVSFRDDYRHEWPEILPPHRRGQGPHSASTLQWRPPAAPLHSFPKGLSPLDLNIEQSFETAEDGNSTTTSGSYTVDDLSPRGINGPYLSPEQAVV